VSRFLIEGRHPISGTIEPKGSKNAALPIIAATLLTDEAVSLTRLPDIADVRVMASLVEGLGSSVTSIKDNRATFKAASIRHSAPDRNLAQAIRASFLLAGPLLARTGSATLPRPGGDRIGRRPLDAHIIAFQEMGVEVEISPDSYRLTAPKGLKPADIFLLEMSVMATENVVMAAVLAPGTTHIHNAASEPHIQDLCRMLVAMGARIGGIGSNVLTIDGATSLHGCTHEIGPDYLEVGSFIGLAAATGGDLVIRNCRPREHRMTAIAFGRLGIEWEVKGEDIHVPRHPRLDIQEDMHGALTKIDDGPWPAFPADLISIGLSSPDIRAGMGLVIAALCAEGHSEIQNVEQIDRGYERLDERLRHLGAKIERVD
jgi:UDP-N-acetylglucosamine 1-carboxyvinyltransferase